MRLRASDGDSGEAIVSLDLNSEQNEDFLETTGPAGDGVLLSRVTRCLDGVGLVELVIIVLADSSVGRVAPPSVSVAGFRTVSTPVSVFSLSSSSSSSYSESGFSLIRIISFDRFTDRLISGSRDSRLSLDLARLSSARALFFVSF